jgi:hypothetical protein
VHSIVTDIAVSSRASTSKHTVTRGDQTYYLEPRRVELLWIGEVVRVVMDVPEQRHHLPTLGDKQPYTPRKWTERIRVRIKKLHNGQLHV